MVGLRLQEGTVTVSKALGSSLAVSLKPFADISETFDLPD